MGVKGLTTYARSNRRALSHSISLPSVPLDSDAPRTALVVDAWSLIYSLYFSSGLSWISGGEYAAFGKLLKQLVEGWRAVGLEPVFVFDVRNLLLLKGPASHLKHPTIISRLTATTTHLTLLSRSSPYMRSSSAFLRSIPVLPPLAYDAFASAALASDAECIWDEGEADMRVVREALARDGFWTGNDSDFFVAGVYHKEGKGYAPLDEMTWMAAPEPASGVSGRAGGGDGDGFTVVSGRSSPSTRSSKLVPPSHIDSLTLQVFSPHLLAHQLSLLPSHLPLFAALVGNDFTTASQHSLLFPAGMAGGKRVERVAEVLREATNGKRRRGSPVGETAVEMVERAVRALMLRDPASGLVTKTVDAVISSSLAYLPPVDPSLFSTPSLSHPHAAAVFDLYRTAYGAGRLSPRLLEAVREGVFFSRVIVEDVDLQSVGVRVGRGLREWVWAVLQEGCGIAQLVEEDAAEELEELVERLDLDEGKVNVEDLDEELEPLERPDSSEAEGSPSTPPPPRQPTITEHLRRSLSIQPIPLPIPSLASLYPSLSTSTAPQLLPLPDRRALYLAAHASSHLAPRVAALPDAYLPLVLAARHAISSMHDSKSAWKERELGAVLAATVVSRRADPPPAAQQSPTFSPANVQIAASLLSSLEASQLLSDALLLSEHLPPAHSLYSGSQLHAFLDVDPGADAGAAYGLEAEELRVWDGLREASLEGLEAAVVRDASVKDRRKEKKARAKERKAGAVGENGNSRGGGKVGGNAGAFALLAELGDE